MAIHGTIDLSFTILAPTDGDSFELITDILAIPQHLETAQGILTINIIYEEDIDYGTGAYIVSETRIGGVAIDTQTVPIGIVNGDIDLDMRIFLFDTYISAYCNDLCVYTYALNGIDYNAITSLSLERTGSYTIENLFLREIPDAREAVWVDYEATTESTIQSIIQQRPIEINPEVGREINFTYDATKDDIPNHHIFSYEDTEQDNLQMSSDGIVYYEDVGVAINEDTAREIGFITRMYRLSELSTGAIEAAKKYQRSALQRRHSSSIVMQRLDPRIEVRDVILIDLIATGTLRHIEDEVIVEDVSISISDGAYSTNISGRRNG